jgi:hypothetical protein
MDRLSAAVSGAANAVNKATFGETNADETAGNLGHSQRGSSRTTGESLTRDDGPGRYTLNEPKRDISGQKSPGVSALEDMESGTGRGMMGSGKMPGSFGSEHTGGSRYNAQTGTLNDLNGRSEVIFGITHGKSDMKDASRNFPGLAHQTGLSSADTTDNYPIGQSTTGQHPSTVSEAEGSRAMGRDPTTGRHMGILGHGVSTDLTSSHRDTINVDPLRDNTGSHPDTTINRDPTAPLRDNTGSHPDTTINRDSIAPGITGAAAPAVETPLKRESAHGESISPTTKTSDSTSGVRSVNAPPGPTRTEVTTAGRSGVPGSEPTGPNTGLGGAHGGPGAAASSSFADAPDRHAEQAHHHQGGHRPMETPSSDTTGRTTHGDTSDAGTDAAARRKSMPLIEGHPESSGPTTHPEGLKLPSAPGTGNGTGGKHVKSTGLAAEGGDFDAAAPGAGKEAE